MRDRDGVFLDGNLSADEGRYGRNFHVNYCKDDECVKDGLKKVEEFFTTEERFDPRLFSWTLEGYQEWVRSIKFR